MDSIFERLKKENEELKQENDHLTSQLHFLLNNYEREDTCQTHYSMIDNIAIGDRDSSYSTFPTVLDISPFHIKNSVTRHFGKTVYKIRFSDTDLVDQLLMVESLPINERILFHCETGLTYSALFAIVYLTKKESCALKKTIDRVKRIRNIEIDSYLDLLHFLNLN